MNSLENEILNVIMVLIPLNYNVISHLLNKKVVNLLSTNFNPLIYRILEKGLNFSLATRKIPIEYIIVT